MGGRVRQPFSNPIGAAVIFVALVIFVLTILKAGDLITGDIPRRESVSSKYSMLVGEPAPEFKLLQDYLSKAKSNNNRILWYPLNFANYIFIPDSPASRGVYVGTSYLRETTRQRDYPGFYNLGPQQELIKKSMMKGDLGPLCHAVWQNNINLVITNNFLLNENFMDKVKPYFSYERDFDILEPQRSVEFKINFFGAVVASFGQGLDLYQIHPNLLSEKLEVYEGDAWKDELRNRNWCVKSEIGKVVSSYNYDANLKEYALKTSIKNAQKISVILADELGYRYRLAIESPAADQIEAINYKQDGAKFIVNVTFSKPFTGEFLGRLVSQSWFEKHMKLILAFQALILASALLYVTFRMRAVNNIK